MIELEALLDIIAPAIKEAADLSAKPGPQGEPGRDGADGKDGADGAQGSPGADGEPGRQGDAGPQGEPGRDGADGAPGADGKDGVSPSPEDVVKAMLADVVKAAELAAERKLAEQAVHWERQALAMAEKAIAAMPKPQDGKDGRDFGAIKFVHDGRRKITVTYEKDGATESEGFEIPAVIDAGFWKDGGQYESGDFVTHGGSAWVAQAATGSKPETGNPDWRLAVRRGRDSK